MFLNRDVKITGKKQTQIGLDEEDMKLFQRMHKGDKDERDELILKYSSMVDVLVSRYIGKTKAPLEDLRQVGMIGLIIAIDRFDCSLGYSVNTYARWKVLSNIAKYLSQEYPIIRVPMSRVRIYKKFLIEHEHIENEDIPTEIKLIGLLLQNMNDSWDDNKVESIIIKKEWKEEVAFINEHFYLLNDREKYVLKGIFSGKSLRKIAGELSVSHEAIRQSRTLVVEKMKRKRMVAHV